MGAIIVDKLVQKLTTNDGEICHQVNEVATEEGYMDALLIRKRVLTQRPLEYQNAGFVVLRYFKGYAVVQQNYAIKIETLHSVYNWVKSVYTY